jgi:hypothetical protein
MDRMTAFLVCVFGRALWASTSLREASLRHKPHILARAAGPSRSLDSDRLGEVARLVHVRASCASRVIRQQLQRDHVQDR